MKNFFYRRDEETIFLCKRLIHQNRSMKEILLLEHWHQ